MEAAVGQGLIGMFQSSSKPKTQQFDPLFFYKLVASNSRFGNIVPKQRRFVIVKKKHKWFNVKQHLSGNSKLFLLSA